MVKSRFICTAKSRRCKSAGKIVSYYYLFCQVEKKKNGVQWKSYGNDRQKAEGLGIA